MHALYMCSLYGGFGRFSCKIRHFSGQLHGFLGRLEKRSKKIKKLLTSGGSFETVTSHAEQINEIMRTKSMILGAALLAAGVASSMAQSNVYSLNVVGYINISLASGLNLIANNLDLDGTGTNNLMTNVLNPLVAANNTAVAVYKWDTNTSGFDQWNYSTHGGGGWVNETPGSGLPFTSATLNPGEGAFVNVANATNLTVVGNVLQNTWTNSNLVPGNLSMASPIAPLANNIDSTGAGGLNFTVVPPCTRSEEHTSEL